MSAPAKSGMIEVRIHGRGGQGNVVAAYMLATAAIREGRFAQAFPSFGAERRGAPVTAFVRVSDQPIRQRCQVRQPDFLIVQDQALLHTPEVVQGIDGVRGILVNTSADPAAFVAQLRREPVVVPATALAVEELGRPVPNTALLAAFLALTGLLPQQALVGALAERFSGQTLAANTRLIERAARLVPAGVWSESEHEARA